MNKICTSIEQSKKLAEILPLESADMWWNFYSVTTDDTTPLIIHLDTPWVGNFNWDNKSDNVPCWSLAALLDVLESEIDGEEGETYQLNIEKDGTWWNVWYRERYDEANPIETESIEELIDACVEMIIKLHEQKLL